MKKTLLFTFMVGLSSNAFAVEKKCQVKSVFNMVAFGSEYVKGRNLLSNGSIGSGNSIAISNSDIDNSDCRALSSQGNVTVDGSRINGSIEGFGKLKISNTIVEGQVRSPNKIDLTDSTVGTVVSPKGSTLVNSTRERWWTSSIINSVDLSKFKNDVLTASKNFASLPRSADIRIIPYKENVTLSLKNTENVVSITAADLGKIKRLEIRGNKEQSLIINITGESADLNQSVTDISGDIEPFNIVWNFYEAKSVSISETGDQVLGHPGRIIAPLADVKLENALVSGGIYAKSVEFNSTNENNNAELREIKYLEK